MMELMTVLLLSLAAVALNAYAAAVADRSTDRRARLEAGWSALIAGVHGDERARS